MTEQSPEAIIRTAEEWLRKPIKQDIQEATDTATEIVVAIVAMMKAEVGPRKELGGLLGQVKSMRKAINNIEMMDWVAIEKGFLAIGHRPSTKMGMDLKLQYTTHILTLLSEGEQAKSIESLASRNNLGWLWFPMTTAQPPEASRFQELASLFDQMQRILENGGKIYVHCSAGIHRTGMISFAFLRFLGIESEPSMELLKALRVKTSEGVGTERVAWANENINKIRNA